MKIQSVHKSRIHIYREYFHHLPIDLLILTFLVFVSACTEIPTSEFSKPQGIGVASDVARKDSNVFFFEDFEDENYESHFHKSSKPNNRRLITGSTVFNGEQSLLIAIDKGSHYGSSLNYLFKEAGMNEPTELYARYYLRFDDSWVAIKGGGKLPGPAGTYDRGGWGGKTSNGTNGWSTRMLFANSSAGAGFIDIGYYTYHAGMKTKYGEYMYWSKDNHGTLKKNQWYCIETYVKLNSIGKNDGILRGWVDGHLAMEEKNITFRTTPDLKIEEYWVNVYYGGSWTAPHDMHLYIDNLALSTNRIGTATTP